MTVYVDDMNAAFYPKHRPGIKYIMCHMVGDDDAELHAMAAKIGLPRSAYDKDHYDVTKTKRELAVKLGAVEVTWRQAAAMMVNKRWGYPMGTPETCEAIAMRRRQSR